jgi:hypothetical protein
VIHCLTKGHPFFKIQVKIHTNDIYLKKNKPIKSIYSFL